MQNERIAIRNTVLAHAMIVATPIIICIGLILWFFT